MRRSTFNLAIATTACIVLGAVLGTSIMAVLEDEPSSWIQEDGRSNWLGFWGAIIGSMVTLIGGGLAYAAATETVKASRSDSAVLRLRGYVVALRRAYEIATEIHGRSTGHIDPADFMRMQDILADERLSHILFDSVAKEDTDAIAYFKNLILISMEFAPKARTAWDICHFALEDITKAISTRIDLIENGISPIDVSYIKMIDASMYFIAMSTGKTEILYDGAAFIYKS